MSAKSRLRPSSAGSSRARPRTTTARAGSRAGAGSASGTGSCRVYTVLAFIFLLIPIVYTFVFSFNDSLQVEHLWRGFTLDNWLNVCDVEGGASARRSATASSSASSRRSSPRSLGTMIAIALVRYRFRARSAISLLLFLPMATPEVVLGAGLAAQFLAVGVPKGMTTIILAHTMFCISFVVVTVQGAGREPRPGARGGGPRPLRVAGAGVLADHVPAADSRASSPRRCCRSR